MLDVHLGRLHSGTEAAARAQERIAEQTRLAWLGEQGKGSNQWRSVVGAIVCGIGGGFVGMVIAMPAAIGEVIGCGGCLPPLVLGGIIVGVLVGGTIGALVGRRLGGPRRL